MSTNKFEDRVCSDDELFSAKDTLNRDVVTLTFQNLDLTETTKMVMDNSAGAISTFIGTTRDNFEGIFN